MFVKTSGRRQVVDLLEMINSLHCLFLASEIEITVGLECNGFYISKNWLQRRFITTYYYGQYYLLQILKLQVGISHIKQWLVYTTQIGFMTLYRNNSPHTFILSTIFSLIFLYLPTNYIFLSLLSLNFRWSKQKKFPSFLD